MSYKFLNPSIQKNNLSSLNSDMIAPILLENNKEQLKKFYDFYEGSNPILYMNGFLGTGKLQLAEYSFNFLSEETIVLKYNCFETTILDDIFLSFFEEFKNLIIKHVINDPKVKTDNFTQKINAYFASIDKPIVIFLNSFEAILKENRQDIINFLQHLMLLKKVKIIFTAKVYEGNLFPANFKISRITTTALSKKLFEQFVKSEKISFNQAPLDELFKNTRGYYFYTMISLKIMSNQKLDVDRFISLFKDSYLTFYEFLEKKSLEIIPSIAVQFFWTLCLFRHGVPIKLLQPMKLYDENHMNFLIENNLLQKDNDIIYVPTFFKDQVDATVPKNILVKIHKCIYDIYQQQLPLKPMERTILLSRQTMRNEAEYHSLFIPKRYTVEGEKQSLTNHLTYAPIEKPQNEDTPSSNTEQQQPEANQPQTRLAPTSGFGTFSRPNTKIDFAGTSLKLSAEEMALLQSGNEETASEEFMKEISLEVVQEKEPETFRGLINAALVAENNYEFKKVITYLTKALNYKNEPEYIAQVPIIYDKLANAYKQLTDWNNTLKYYNFEKEFFENTQEYVKANNVRLNIAKVYYETYKVDKAKTLLQWVLNQPSNTDLLTVKACIDLATIEEDSSNIESAFNYYKMGVDSSKPTMDIDLLAILYFKYALFSDDKDDIKTAFTFYKKCIHLTDDPYKNKYLSSSYTNLAALYLEDEDVEMAYKQYEKAYELDKRTDSAEGMFFATLKMGQLLEYEDSNKALEYFTLSKNHSITTNDKFFMASASLALGDFYFDRQNDLLALTEYVWTLNLVKDEFSQDNLSKIQERIDDVRLKLGEDSFNNLLNSIKQ